MDKQVEDSVHEEECIRLHMTANFKNAMKKMTGSKESLDTQISRLLFTCRHAPSTVTGVSPAELLFKQKPKTRLSMLRSDVSMAWRKSAEKMISSRPGGKQRKFVQGEKVIARSYRGGEKWIMGTIQEKTGPLSYKVRINGGVVRRHVDQIRIYRRIECPPSSGEVDGVASMPASVESPHQVEQ